MLVTTEIFKVKTNEIGANKKVTLPALANFMQEAARLNVTEMGIPTSMLAEKGLAWVLSRLKLEIFDYVGQGEALKIKTWPSGSDKYYFYRDFRFFNSKDELIARASSNWIAIDLGKRQLVRVPEFLKDLTVNAGEEPLPRISGKIKPLTETHGEHGVKVKWHYLDEAQHTNNSYYFQWILDALPRGVLDSHLPKKLDMMFKAESVYNDQLISRYQKVSELETLHTIGNSVGKELIRAFVEWE